MNYCYLAITGSIHTEHHSPKIPVQQPVYDQHKSNYVFVTTTIMITNLADNLAVKYPIK